MDDVRSFYKVEQVEAGDGKSFPKKGETVACHYVGTVNIITSHPSRHIAQHFLNLTIQKS